MAEVDEQRGAERDDASDSDGADDAHLAELGSMIFLPGLQAWALSMMGFSAATIFKAWRGFVKQYGGSQQRIGGDVAAQVGQYVVPNRGCPPEVEEDAMGMAGRITRVIRSDGTVETDGKEQTDAEESCASAERVDRTAGDGREIVFVRWAADGVERGGYALPNRWQLLMAGTSVEPQQDEYTVQAFPLCLATEEMMIEAKHADTSRDFQNAVADLPSPPAVRRPARRENNRRILEFVAQDTVQSIAKDWIRPQSKKTRRKKSLFQRGGYAGMTFSTVQKHRDVSPLGFLAACHHPTVTTAQKEPSSSSEELDDEFRGDDVATMQSPLPPLASADLRRTASHGASATGSISHRSGSVSHRSANAARSPSGVPRSPTTPSAADGVAFQRTVQEYPQNREAQPEPARNESTFKMSMVANMEDTQKSADRTGAGSVTGMQSPVGGSAMHSPISRRLPRTLSSNSMLTVETLAKSPIGETYAAISEDSSICEETGASLCDFVKPRFLNSDFLVSPLSKRTRISLKARVDKHLLTKPKNELTNTLKRTNTLVGIRLKTMKQKATNWMQKSVNLKKLATKQKALHNIEFNCRIIEEKELKYLPIVVAAHPGRPRSILLVAPMNQHMNSKEVRYLSSELRHLQTSTVCVRDMTEPIHVKDLCDTIKTLLPMVLNTKGAKSLTTLCLSRVFLGPETMSYFTQSILKSAACRLKHLYCLSNSLGDAGAIQIAQCLSQVDTASRARIGVASCLVSLSLEQNEIRDKGAAALGQAVADHPCLEQLNLRGNLITDKGAAAMSVIVHKNATLTQLNFSDNRVIGAGNDAFDRALRRPDSMAERLTVVSGTLARPRLACRPKSAKPFSSQRYPQHSVDISHHSTESNTHKCLQDGRRGSKQEMDRQLFSDREHACEEHRVLERRKAQKREDGRNHLIKSSLLEHANKTQDSQNAIKFITEMGKTIKRMQIAIETIEKEQKPGWEQQKERIQNELEWCARDIARREKIVREADKEMRQDIMQLLYKQNMVIQQEHFIHVDIEPSADFLEDMEIIHGSNKTEVEEDAEPEFPPEGTKENFLFDSKQMQGLELDSSGAHLLTDSSLNPRNPVANSSVSYLKGNGDWASALLEPAIAMGPASFVEFVVLGQPSNVKKQNMLFGISKEPFDVKKNVDAPFMKSTGVMFYPRYGRIYHGAEVVHTTKRPIILKEGDMLGMMVNDAHTHLIFYYTEKGGLRQEVTQFELKDLKDWDHTVWSVKRLRWAVTLGNVGQSLQVHKSDREIQRIPSDPRIQAD